MYAVLTFLTKLQASVDYPEWTSGSGMIKVCDKWDHLYALSAQFLKCNILCTGFPVNVYM